MKGNEITITNIETGDEVVFGVDEKDLVPLTEEEILSLNP